MESFKNKHSTINNILNKDFILSAIIPLIIFEAVSFISTDLNALILSGIWCIAVFILNYILSKKLNALAAIGAIFNVIGIVGSLISKNPTFYLAAPIIQDFLFALILIISVCISHPLIQVVAEQSFTQNLDNKIKNTPSYKSSWIILTLAWAIIYIVQGLLRIVMLKLFSISVYYVVSSIYSNTSIPLFIGASIIFGKWYVTKSIKNS